MWLEGGGKVGWDKVGEVGGSQMTENPRSQPLNSRFYSSFKEMPLMGFSGKWYALIRFF